MVAVLLGITSSVLVVRWWFTPHIEVVATYGHEMPWDFLLMNKDSTWCTNALHQMVFSHDTDFQQALNKSFDFTGISREPDWDSSWMANFGTISNVQNELMANPLTSTQFVAYSHFTNMLHEGRGPKTSRTTWTDIRVAITPGVGGEGDVTNLLQGFRDAVKQTLKDNRLSNLSVESVWCPTYEDVIEKLANHDIDLALCSPYSAYIVHEALSDKICLLASTRKAPFGKDVFENGYDVELIKSSRIPKLAQCRKRPPFKFIYSSKCSTSGYLIAVSMLNGLGLLDSTVFEEPEAWHTNHQAVIEAVSRCTNYLAAVPSDQLAPRMDVSPPSWIGAGFGAAVGCIWICFRERLRQK
jgi:ABC-type phosphate/phosphonate transport system substrate-binding protein